MALKWAKRAAQRSHSTHRFTQLVEFVLVVRERVGPGHFGRFFARVLHARADGLENCEAGAMLPVQSVYKSVQFLTEHCQPFGFTRPLSCSLLIANIERAAKLSQYVRLLRLG